MKRKKTDEFQVKAEDGRTFTVIEWTPIHDASSHDGPATVRGLPELRTSEGYAVNPPDEAGRFEIVELDLKVTRV